MLQEKLPVTGSILPVTKGVSVTEGSFPVKKTIFLVTGIKKNILCRKIHFLHMLQFLDPDVNQNIFLNLD